LRIEIESAIQEMPAEKRRTAGGIEVCELQVTPYRQHSASIGQRLAVSIHQNHVAKANIHFGMCSEKLCDLSECASEILLIAIQVSADSSTSSSEATVDRVVHSSIRLAEHSNRGVGHYWGQGLRIGPTILNDVLDFDPFLVCDRGYGQR
jgi:hypothetical protein